MLAVGQPAFNSSLFENGVNIEQRNDNTDRDEWRLCRTMNTSLIIQEPNWCWVTCAKMVAESYGYNDPNGRSIRDAVNHVFGDVIYDGGAPPDIVDACQFLTYGELAFSYNGTCSEGVLRLLLDDGNPMILCLNHPSIGRHAVVIYGYYYDGDTCRFLVNDPAPTDRLENLDYIQLLYWGWEVSVAKITKYFP